MQKPGGIYNYAEAICVAVLIFLISHISHQQINSIALAICTELAVIFALNYTV